VAAATSEYLDRLRQCLEVVHTASRNLTSLPDQDQRAAYFLALTELAVAWSVFKAPPPGCRTGGLRRPDAAVTAQIGDDLFYGFGATDEAVAAVEAGLSMVPNHTESSEGNRRGLPARQRSSPGEGAAVRGAAGRDGPLSGGKRDLHPLPDCRPLAKRAQVRIIHNA
jgi:hypothetical protein